MVERNFTDDEETGFSRYGQDRHSKGILLPTPIAKAIEAEAAEFLAAAAREAAAEKAALQAAAAKAAVSKGATAKGPPLPSIRIHTPHDLADALLFARGFLANVTPPGVLSAQLSEDLLVAVLLVSAYRYPDYAMPDVLLYLIDPLWDTPKQIFAEIKNTGSAFVQTDAAAWFEKFNEQIEEFWRQDDGTLTQLFKTVHLHWSNALDKPPQPVVDRAVAGAAVGAVPHRVTESAIQVFSAQALEKAVVTFGEMPADRKTAGKRILEQTRAGYGRRSLPDMQQAIKNLEAKKCEFENLLQPIERLQEDLLLASVMPAQEFRLSPILLLGDPGIGKTFLASQLAQALGVPSEKISAGGGQSSFQLTGSHSTWIGAKPGMVAALLAQSAFAAPVLVVDEVDKIQDDRYPLLPVLLDLLDTDTAQRFRDEYFEMEFDASRILVVLTANDIRKVPLPLLSRVEVFTVAAPQPSQRLRIIEQTMASLSEKTGRSICLAPGAAEQLSERLDIDLRQLHRLVRASFTVALQAGNAVARIKQPDAMGLSGFNLAAWTPQDRSC